MMGALPSIKKGKKKNPKEKKRKVVGPMSMRELDREGGSKNFYFIFLFLDCQLVHQLYGRAEATFVVLPLSVY